MNNTWTEFLAREGAAIDDGVVRFGAAADEARALETGAVLVPLQHLGLIRSRGEDSTPFLHNLFSNDVKKLAVDGAQWNSFNSPKGRMLASMLVWPQDDGHMLAMSADILPPMLKKLSMYVLRSKVKLADASDEVCLFGLAGPTAAALLQTVGLPLPEGSMKQVAGEDCRVIRVQDAAFVLAVSAATASARFAALAAAGARKAGTSAWQLAMIRAGVPLITGATQEEFVAQMLNYELIGGVSFTKGCYPGQEIVARTQYLGKLKKRMYRVHLDVADAPAAGTDLFAPDFGEQSVGKLVNVSVAPAGGFEALAVMQSSSAEAGEVHLGTPDGPRLAFLDLPYALS